jgi:EAL domain-containing protein (putative c-di-GMP-specific phosphodiesterase class I)
MGGDEFTILLPDIAEERAAALVAQKALDAVSQPVVIEGHELYVTTSIGIATYPEGGTDVETLTKNADRAMYRAKELGRNNYQFASSVDSPEARLRLETSLLRAFEEKEFILHYQPMIETDSGRVVGAEALVRWRHPDGRLLFPEEFINVAEESRLIIPLGEWVMRAACEQGRKWLDAGYPLRVAVNLSPRQFQQRDLAVMIESVLADTHFPADLLELEVSETTAMQNPELSTTIIRGLKELGLRISIDDFGTGYSSLSYLRKLPIDTVKIDQNFVRDLADPTSVEAAIVTSVMSIARALNLRVVAEGVETEEQLASLEREECAAVQGYLYSRPVPPEEFEATLRARA